MKIVVREIEQKILNRKTKRMFRLTKMLLERNDRWDHSKMSRFILLTLTQKTIADSSQQSDHSVFDSALIENEDYSALFFKIIFIFKFTLTSIKKILTQTSTDRKSFSSFKSYSQFKSDASDRDKTSAKISKHDANVMLQISRDSQKRNIQARYDDDDSQL